MELHNAINEINNYIEGCYEQPSIQHQHLAGAGAIYDLIEKLCYFYNKKHAVAFSNATTALQAVCLAMDLKNSEVITSPVNWGGSVAPFLLHGNKLRFTSVDSASLNLDVSDLPSAITSKTKAVLSVDYNGTPADSEAIKKFCVKNGLHYISDSAQSFGAYRDGKPSGFFADAIILSFSPGKSFFAGEGGAVVTDDDELFEKLIWYSQHPSKQKTVFGISNYNQYAPLNGRMNPLSAILLNETFESSLRKLKNYQEQCFEIASQLQKEGLVEESNHIRESQSSTFFNFSLQLKPEVSEAQVNEFLKSNHKPFQAQSHSLSLIPYDAQFRFQFKGKFSCTKSLKQQESSDFLEDRITLNHSQ